ncbi:MAG: HAD-IA family hydrolase [Saprospiraceae bacterium]|nr:HAD-IA family hydrolase [Candidatus Vicinibacter affinis]
MGEHRFEKLFPYGNHCRSCQCIKPNIRIFEYALNAINAEAAQCMYIGDSPEVDGHGALNAGMQFVWLNTEGRENKFNFRQIADLGELITVL